MTSGRICITPIANAKSLPDPCGDWTPLRGCAEWDGVVTVNAKRQHQDLKLSFSLYPPLFGELVVSDRQGITRTSKLPVILQRPTPDDPDIIADCLIAGLYVLRCDFDGFDDLRLDLELSEWYAID